MFGKDKRHMRGVIGESMAESYLHNIGWRIIARNWHCLKGEIDIIAMDGQTLVFVEVKTRDADTPFDPQTAVNLKKRQNLRAAAAQYMRQWQPTQFQYRYDIVSVLLKTFNELDRIELIRNAFRDERQKPMDE